MLLFLLVILLNHSGTDLGYREDCLNVIFLYLQPCCDLLPLLRGSLLSVVAPPTLLSFQNIPLKCTVQGHKSVVFKLKELLLQLQNKVASIRFLDGSR